jgi:hypothetical protein
MGGVGMGVGDQCVLTHPLSCCFLSPFSLGSAKEQVQPPRSTSTGAGPAMGSSLPAIQAASANDDLDGIPIDFFDMRVRTPLLPAPIHLRWSHQAQTHPLRLQAQKQRRLDDQRAPAPMAGAEGGSSIDEDESFFDMLVATQVQADKGMPPQRWAPPTSSYARARACGSFPRAGPPL